MMIITKEIVVGEKPHYELLDALRGVAAMLVIAYHVGEGFCTSAADIFVNHGYLAVDFFFMLSGFVITYAYDDRWRAGMSNLEFLKGRLIRLHPMVVAGVTLGVISYCIQGRVTWGGEHIGWWWIAVSALMALLLIPVAPGSPADIRGNNECFPINGPEWSLFFEYIGYVVYAYIVRKLSTRNLTVVAAFAGVGLVASGVYDLGGGGGLGMGWTLAGYNFPGGMLRLLFAFSMGMLIERTFHRRRVKGAFLMSSALLIAVMAMPFVGSAEESMLNGAYDAVCVVVVFPAVLWLGACGEARSKSERRLCRFLGDLSYPVYIVHYPAMYLLYSYVWGEGLCLAEAWPAVVAAVGSSLFVAWALMRWYDAPVRRWLSRK